MGYPCVSEFASYKHSITQSLVIDLDLLMVVGMLEEKLHIQHVTVLYRSLNAHLGADNAYHTPDSYNLLTVASVLCLHCGFYITA